MTKANTAKIYIKRWIFYIKLQKNRKKIFLNVREEEDEDEVNFFVIWFSVNVYCFFGTNVHKLLGNQSLYSSRFYRISWYHWFFKPMFVVKYGIFVFALVMIWTVNWKLFVCIDLCSVLISNLKAAQISNSCVQK